MTAGKKGTRGKAGLLAGVGISCLDVLTLRYIFSSVPERNPIQSRLNEEELLGSLTGSPRANPTGVAGFRVHLMSRGLMFSP